MAVVAVAGTVEIVDGAGGTALLMYGVHVLGWNVDAPIH